MTSDRSHAPTSHPATSAFRPLHKRAFGTATGVAAALVTAAFTALHIVRAPEHGLPLELLAEYFAGYTVSWPGVFIGAAWAGFVGFVFGWFFAFGRNFVIAAQLVFVRTRAEMVQTRDFLDHI